MYYTGALPSTSIYSTWIETVEITSADDGQLVDLSILTEATLKLIDPYTRWEELILNMTNGDITVPSTGIIQWRVESTRMGNLRARLYEVVLLLNDGSTIVDLLLGNISIVE